MAECRLENDHLRAQLKTIENRLIGSKNKLAIIEKSIAISEEKNEAIRGQIDDTQARISNLEVEVVVLCIRIRYTSNSYCGIYRLVGGRTLMKHCATN